MEQRASSTRATSVRARRAGSENGNSKGTATGKSAGRSRGPEPGGRTPTAERDGAKKRQARADSDVMVSSRSFLEQRLLLSALVALKKGDFSVRLPIDLEGVDGKIADTFNDVVELNHKLAKELERL